MGGGPLPARSRVLYGPGGLRRPPERAARLGGEDRGHLRVLVVAVASLALPHDEAERCEQCIEVAEADDFVRVGEKLSVDFRRSGHD